MHTVTHSLGKLMFEAVDVFLASGRYYVIVMFTIKYTSMMLVLRKEYMSIKIKLFRWSCSQRY